MKKKKKWRFQLHPLMKTVEFQTSNRSQHSNCKKKAVTIWELRYLSMDRENCGVSLVVQYRSREAQLVKVAWPSVGE